MRKQLFVTAYCYFLYVHFLINLGVGSFLMWKINHTTSVDKVAACQKAITNPGTRTQCDGLLNITRGVLIGFIALVLSIELCKPSYCKLPMIQLRYLPRILDGALIATRYMRQLRGEKRHGRGATYSSLGSEHNRSAYTPGVLSTGDESERSVGMKPPGFASTTSPAATYFPLTPQMKSATEKHDSDV